ncbi:response regulator transcription factor [Amycolatopsis sp. EV170708-02-1]|uniref:response regulator transcription factor n=1 Tax=Amycolatopsis sp. EV170708-02-1 TaxID=2919322 RepID=UPI001F0C3582|nr:response regulator transcription factor [Amycolatopsis sp. EV170708-02-1]UMP06987.1 response regulator transcription factor [Amycolatopsis sp. EV170708-02-1]
MSIILIIDDERVDFASAKELFAAHGHTMRNRSAMIQAKDVALSGADVVLLNLCRTVPEEELMLRQLRRFSNVPIVVASNHSDEHIVTAALNLGADDYLVKPCSFSHVLARIDAVLRRISATSPRVNFIEVGDLRINFEARSIVRDGKTLGLTPTEFDLLALLARYLDTVVSREDAIKALWSRADPSAYQVLRVHVSSLRRKLGDSATSPRYLHTLHGVGLKLTSTDESFREKPIEVHRLS